MYFIFAMFCLLFHALVSSGTDIMLTRREMVYKNKEIIKKINNSSKGHGFQLGNSILCINYIALKGAKRYLIKGHSKKRYN